LLAFIVFRSSQPRENDTENSNQKRSSLAGADHQVYDFAPFRPIIEGAGGVVSDWEGRGLSLDSGSRVLAAATPELHEEALRLLSKSRRI
jgi:hypothetical protein